MQDHRVNLCSQQAPYRAKLSTPQTSSFWPNSKDTLQGQCHLKDQNMICDIKKNWKIHPIDKTI